jgi:hypothetical protein
MIGKCVLLGLCLTGSTALAQQSDIVELGKLANGANVWFIRAPSTDWGITVAGSTAPPMIQPKPAEIQVYRGLQNISDIAVGYQSVQKEGDTVVAKAKVTSEKAAFDIEDRWKVSGAALLLSRKVTVTGAEDNAGFYSAVHLLTATAIKWEDVNCLVPGLLYDDPSHAGGGSPAGVAPYRAKRFTIREDYLSAPMIGMAMKDGNWAAVLDMAPKGDTTQAESNGGAGAIIDERITIGTLGARETIYNGINGTLGGREITGGGMELGFWFPCTTAESGGGRGGRGGGAGATASSSSSAEPTVGQANRGTQRAPGGAGATASSSSSAEPTVGQANRGTQRAPGGTGATASSSSSAEPTVGQANRGTQRAPTGETGSVAAAAANVRGRYHPVKAGFTQNYQVGFCFGKSASYNDMQRDVWRWAWESLKPSTKLMPIDPDVARRVLLDQLSGVVQSVDGRTGIPFEMSSVDGRYSQYGQKIIMGFCGKNLEGADELLQEGDRDKTERGRKMRQQGLAIIDSLIRQVPMSPPAGVGYNIQTGEPVPANFVPGFTLRMPAEDLAVLVNTYRREKKAGHDHPEWLKWVTDYCDWLLTQQGADGSFPAAWQARTSQVIRDGKTTTYVPVPVLVRMGEETGQKQYIDAAIKAAEFVWNNYGSKGVYMGATGTGNNIADKESGMLSMEAFLALYDNTKDPKWLDRAKAAADYTETWIWIWNVPMPIDADDAALHWKKGVPTVGVNGIGADVVGGVDQYLDWAVPSYAKLYKLTKDEHYLDVAYVLLHGTKAMLALPGRTYDLQGPGWQQEHWNMGPGRKGMGSHRNWLVWITANHLNGIMGLEAFDPDLYKRLSKRE